MPQAHEGQWAPWLWLAAMAAKQRKLQLWHREQCKLQNARQGGSGTGEAFSFSVPLDSATVRVAEVQTPDKACAHAAAQVLLWLRGSPNNTIDAFVKVWVLSAGNRRGTIWAVLCRFWGQIPRLAGN